MPPPSPIAEEQPFNAPFSFTLHPASTQPTQSARSGWSTRPTPAASPSAAHPPSSISSSATLPLSSSSSSWTTSSAFFTSSSPYPSPASSPVSDVKSTHSGDRKSSSPQRRLDLQQLLAAAQQPPLPSPPLTTRTLSSSSSGSSPSSSTAFTQQPASSSSSNSASIGRSSVFSTSTSTFLQRHTPHPSPSASPATSPLPSPATSPVNEPVLGATRFSTPPRTTPSTIKKGLAASFATILSSPAHYNPGVQAAPTAAAVSASAAASHSSSSSSASSTAAINASMAACSLPAASPFVSFPVPLSAAFTTITSTTSTSTFSPSTSLAHPSYASTGERSPTSHLSPLSSSSSSSSSYSGSESTTPVSARLHPLSRSTPSFSSPPPMGPSPLSSLLFAASELVTASSTDVSATCTSLLRLVLDHAQCDDAKVVTKAANGRWNIDVHVQAAHSSSSTAQPVTCTPPSLLDPHGLLYDSHSSVPDLPLSVLQLVSSTQSLLSLSSADVLSDPVMAGDAFFSSRSLHHRPPPLSLLCLPIVVCRRECGVLLLTWQRAVQAADCVSVPSVQLLMVQVCLLLERRREELRRVEWLMLEDECRERDEECKRVRRELHDTKAQLAAKV